MGREGGAMSNHGTATVRQGLLVALQSGAVGALTDGQLLSRFLGGGDGADAAFEAIVNRHGPTVRTVCANILGATPDADDAFQATFLVLIRRAASIRKLESLGSWLHGVARRTSIRAKNARKTRHAREFGPEWEIACPGSSPDQEMISALHEEIGRLPEHYRLPLQLCEIDGRTHAEAARQLEWPIGTVSGRLSRARSVLKDRFSRRGLTGSCLSLGFPWSERVQALARAELAARVVWRIAFAATWIFAASIAGGSLSVREGREVSPPLPTSPEPRPVALASPPTVKSTPRRLPVVMNWRDEQIVAVTVAPDGKTLAQVRVDSTVAIWDLDLGRERLRFRGHAAPVLSLTFSKDGSSITSSDVEKTRKVWSVRSGRELISQTEADPTDSAPAGA